MHADTANGVKRRIYFTLIRGNAVSDNMAKGDIKPFLEAILHLKPDDVDKNFILSFLNQNYQAKKYESHISDFRKAVAYLDTLFYMYDFILADL